MKLNVSSNLVYTFQEETQIIANIEASSSWDQDILQESLILEPSAKIFRDTNAEGDRRFRANVIGTVKFSYSAIIENKMRLLLPTQGRQMLWSELPPETLQFLLPSRFCPSDKFQRFVQREFSAAGDGVAKVLAALNWINRFVDYVHGVSDAQTTAEGTFVDRAGVCRDFTHLGITFCRAMSIPARAVSAYAFGLTPPDFHAIFEVYLEGAWWLVDATRLAPIDGIVRICTGRDAGDIAFLTTEKPCQLVSQTIEVGQAP